MHRVVSDYTRVDGNETNIKVFVRARPLFNEDAEVQSDFLLTDQSDDRKIVIKDPDSSNRRYGEVSFQFDKVFWTDVNQEEIFNSACRVQVDRILDGYNCCCFACNTISLPFESFAITD